MQNGKSVIVRVNDRGPFHGNRVIDVPKPPPNNWVSSTKARPMSKLSRSSPAKPPLQTIISPNNKEFFVDLKSFGTQREAQAYLNQAAQSLPSDSKIMLEKTQLRIRCQNGSVQQPRTCRRSRRTRPSSEPGIRHLISSALPLKFDTIQGRLKPDCKVSDGLF